MSFNKYIILFISVISSTNICIFGCNAMTNVCTNFFCYDRSQQHSLEIQFKEDTMRLTKAVSVTKYRDCTIIIQGTDCKVAYMNLFNAAKQVIETGVHTNRVSLKTMYMSIIAYTVLFNILEPQFNDSLILNTLIQTLYDYLNTQSKLEYYCQYSSDDA